MPLTEHEAFAAMVRFLAEYWERNGRPDDVGALLGSLTPGPFAGTEPSDPAIWQDWLDAVREVDGRTT